MIPAVSARRSGAALAAFLLAAAVAAAGQQSAPPSQPPMREGVRAAVDVTAMDVDVVATGKGGAPVTDLAKEEITVHVDGKPYAPDYFARITAGQVHGPDLAAASPDVILETTRTGETRWVPRQFLVFFDDEHLMPFERKRVIEGLRDFVTRLSPSDAMAILGCTRCVP